MVYHVSVTRSPFFSDGKFKTYHGFVSGKSKEQLIQNAINQSEIVEKDCELEFHCIWQKWQDFEKQKSISIFLKGFAYKYSIDLTATGRTTKP